MRVLLANMRERSNMTQTQISQCANISQGYYSSIESGFKCPSPVVADRIAKVLGISEHEMFKVFYSDGSGGYRS